MLCGKLVIDHIFVVRNQGEHNISDKGNSHTGLADIIGGHLLVHIQDDVRLKAACMADEPGSSACIIFSFHHNKGVPFKAFQGHNRKSGIQKFTVLNQRLCDLVTRQGSIYGKSVGNSQNQMFLLKNVAVENIRV